MVALDVAAPARMPAHQREPSKAFGRLRDAVRGRGREAAPQLTLITALYLAYRVGRILASGEVGRAFDDAHTMWSFEQWLHLPSETAVQSFFVGRHFFAEAANLYYATAHFTFAVGALLWLWMFRPDFYRWTRNVMVGLTGSAMILHAVLPLAPPRMLPSFGFVDLGSMYGQSVYGPPASDKLANQFAAMPSLHVGWALVLSIALVLATRSHWRWLWLLHPLITTVVVVGTGNHFWLDAVAAMVLLMGSMVVCAPTRPRASDLQRLTADVTTGPQSPVKPTVTSKSLADVVPVTFDRSPE